MNRIEIYRRANVPEIVVGYLFCSPPYRDNAKEARDADLYTYVAVLKYR